MGFVRRRLCVEARHAVQFTTDLLKPVEQCPRLDSLRTALPGDACPNPQSGVDGAP